MKCATHEVELLRGDDGGQFCPKCRAMASVLPESGIVDCPSCGRAVKWLPENEGFCHSCLNRRPEPDPITDALAQVLDICVKHAAEKLTKREQFAVALMPDISMAGMESLRDEVQKGPDRKSEVLEKMRAVYFVADLLIEAGKAVPA